LLRIVADTNIYVSALNFGGVPDQVLSLARRGRIEMFTSRQILDEIDDVLRGKFAWPPALAREALTTIGEFAKLVRPHVPVSVVKKDEPDNRVLECALAANAAIVVSGDSHLRELRSFRGIRIVSPRALLEEIERQASG
jgi:putative PIN family toxin of toxin-antitoxin system